MLFFRGQLMLAASLMMTSCAASDSNTQSHRYRGGYFYGHEVNSFCPQLNSQCYWLSADTGHYVRKQLKKLSEQYRSDLYGPVCVVIEGAIDRNSLREGFASDYDGLITIDRVYGECGAVETVTQGDLQHHRWVLAAIDGDPVDVSQWRRLPTLDFGEQLYVSGNDGCRDFDAWASLNKDKISFSEVTHTESACQSNGEIDLAIELTEGRWIITQPDKNLLRLKGHERILEFELNDWR